MKKIDEKLIALQTKHTSYIFGVTKSGHLEQYHYGEAIFLEGIEGKTGIFIQNMLPETLGLKEPKEFVAGNGIAYGKEFPALGLEDRCLEMSSYGKGDIREPFLELRFADGSSSSDFLFESAEILTKKEELKSLPSSYGVSSNSGEISIGEEKVSHLKVILSENSHKIKLILYYSVYAECDVISRRAVLTNEGERSITINRLMSMQLDFDRKGLRFTNFTGAWAREMNRSDHLVESGMFVNQTMAGVSSSRANPFVMISDPHTTEEFGDCYGFHLLYSGNHYEALEVSPYGKSRFVNGINPRGFQWELLPGESFESPEAAVSFSANGFETLSHQLHDFVRNHIVRGEWKNKTRPVLVNSWEANYFKFDEGKLLKLAKEAKEVGIELFVMDDGWFGERNDDTSSLGDWEPNLKKLPGGIKRLADKINALGLDFGIWVEPEMLNENSECYRNHPDWAVTISGNHHSEGRNQMILDLTRKDVREYIVESMKKVFSSGNISYVKWDMNRIFSDAYSNQLAPQNQGGFYHRYVVGLYEILEQLTKAFPHILFEGCCAGGNRFDLGILSYMPQIWASDNSDAVCRLTIQEGYSYGYPNSVLGAHVSACPNHQTLRNTPLSTRFHVACFGLLGYELNLCELSTRELEEIKAQIALYKKWRDVVFTGDFYRLTREVDSDVKWLMVSKDKTRAFMVKAKKEKGRLDDIYRKLKTRGLKDDFMYHFYDIPGNVDIMAFGDLINTVSPVHIKKDSIPHHLVARFMKMEEVGENFRVYGRNLNHCGVKLKQAYGGTGFNERVRVEVDYDSRLYFIELE